MLKTGFIVLIIVLLTGGISFSAYSQVADSSRIKGEWMLVDADVKTFELKEGALLESVHLTMKENVDQIRMTIPLTLSFISDAYSLLDKLHKQEGHFKLRDGRIYCMPSLAGVPAGIYSYSITAEGVLVIKMPEIFFNDDKRKLSLYDVYECHYQRKK